MTIREEFLPTAEEFLEISALKAKERRLLRSCSNSRNEDRCRVLVSSFTNSYEETLFRANPCGRKVYFSAELVVSRLSEAFNIVTHRERISLAAAPAFPGFLACPFCCRHNLETPLQISRRSVLQLILRDETGTVGKIFLLRLNLSDMPINSQAIVRQKHYYCNSLDERQVLHHALQINVKRVQLASGPTALLDGNGDLRYEPGRSLERTLLYGTIRLVFSFNQAATIGRNLKDDSFMQEQLRIITEFPLDGKYIGITNHKSEGRISPHGEIF